MSVLQRRNQLGKQQRRLFFPDHSIAASLEDFEIESHIDENDLARELAFQSPQRHNRSRQSDVFSSSTGLISDSAFSHTLATIGHENFAQWSYPSPDSLQKWGPSDTDEDADNSQAAPSASPVSSTTTASRQSNQRYRRSGWFSHALSGFEDRISPTDTMIYGRDGSKAPNGLSSYRRQAHSDTPAPNWPMSSPGLGPTRNNEDSDSRRPYRHSASPVPPPSFRVEMARRYTPFFPDRPLQPLEKSFASSTEMDVSYDTAIHQVTEIIPSIEDVQQTQVDTDLCQNTAAAEDGDGADDEAEDADDVVDFVAKLIEETEADEPTSAGGASQRAMQLSSVNADSMTLPDPSLRSKTNLRERKQQGSKVLKRRKKKDISSFRSDLPIPKESEESFFRFDMSAQMRPPANPIPTFFRNKKPSSPITLSRLWSLMIWACGLSLTYMICRSVVWSSNLTITHGTSPGMMVPDLIKVASLARSFEPLIHFSENGVRQVGELEDSGVAVWDLSESVRQTNMTSGPVIVEELDGLSQSLNLLALEMTRFYSGVDSDMDNILIVMDWARRELRQVMLEPAQSPVGQAYDRLVHLLSDTGILESEHDLSVDAITFPVAPDSDVVPRKKRPRSILHTLARMSTAYRSRSTLQITFLELVGALEEAIANELRSSTIIFSLFERVDRQFNNLQRLVAREQAGQERMETDVLESLWTRLTGGSIAMLRKFQNNRRLLGSLRECTKRNKALLYAHNHRLLALRSGLETLRKRLVRPLVRSQPDVDEEILIDSIPVGGIPMMLAMSPSSSSSTGLAGIPDQIRGIEVAYEHLQRVREGQRSRVLKLVYGVDERTLEAIADAQERRYIARGITRG